MSFVQTPALVGLAEDGSEKVVYAVWPHQKKYHESSTPNLLALGTRGTGKALALDTPIPTLRGFVPMSELGIADVVFDEQGRQTRVVAKSVPHIDPTGTYQVMFDDGSVLVCGGQHEWHTIDKRENSVAHPIGSVKTTEYIVSTLKCCKGRETNHRIALGKAWECPKVELPVDPYVLGVWLGDGSKGVGQFTTNDTEIVEEIRKAGYIVTKRTSKYLWTIEGFGGVLRQLDAEDKIAPSRGLCRRCAKNRLFAARALCFRCYRECNEDERNRYPKIVKGYKRFVGGLLHRKRIPACYFMASIAQRLSLLQGLMDTDGFCCVRQGSVEFCNTNLALAQGVFRLAASLGLKPYWCEGRATLYGKDCGPKYRVMWTATLPVFRLTRKLARLPQVVRPTQLKRYIVDVKRIDDQLVQCIEVDSPSHLYQAGYSCIPTHNSLQLRMDAIMRCLMIPNFRALIVRRTMPELRRSHLAYIGVEMAQLGQEYLSTFSQAKFENGSTLTFAHCENESDVMNFLSSEYGFIGFDELSTFTLEQFLKISAAARAPLGSGYNAVIRAGSNPLGVGSDWMYDWFVDKTVRLEDFPDYNPDDFEMQFSTLDDNPSMDAVAYKARLRNLPEHVRRAWLDGERISEGMYFMDFHKTARDMPGVEDGSPWHVIDSMPTLHGESLLGHSWMRVYRAIDWGYFPDPAVCLWIAVLPNKRAIVFKERHWRRTLAADVAADIKRESAGMHIVESFCDPTMLIKEGQNYSIGELFEQNGVPVTPTINDRMLYGYSIHNYLNTIIERFPQLQIYNCPDLVRTIPQLRTDPSDPAKIANGNDHWVVALAYFCMGQASPSRDPSGGSGIPRWMRPKSHRSHAYA